ncbi:MAG: hypothetical protein KDD44_03010, partial [Bdellovibrionales bacterium]|nr:hypothetical protein [Bdellovibrionales bacterium]
MPRLLFALFTFVVLTASVSTAQFVSASAPLPPLGDVAKTLKPLLPFPQSLASTELIEEKLEEAVDEASGTGIPGEELAERLSSGSGSSLERAVLRAIGRYF